jgi:hypothetical protein
MFYYLKKLSYYLPQADNGYVYLTIFRELGESSPVVKHCIEIDFNSFQTASS